MSLVFADERAVMARALELAARGAGFVEPNPQVGAVLVDSQLTLLGEGWHQRFGGPHAEVHALAQAGSRAAGATLFVTLEPCCHFGKTPPCTAAVIAAGVARVVVAVSDPFPAVAGNGLRQLREAGIIVETGLLEAEASELLAPFTKLTLQGLPYVHAKWAMTLDGKLATRTGSSQWISNALSRQVVHELRGRMDAILVGSGTALQDDPLLTARPPGPRVATRIVLDRRGRLPLDSQLVRTAGSEPVLLVTTAAAPREPLHKLAGLGVEILELEVINGRPSLSSLLDELGRRRMTNLLVEGGSEVLGAFFDQRLVDEAHVFIAPKLAGGRAALSPLGGAGCTEMSSALSLRNPAFQRLGDDVYIHGRVQQVDATEA